MTSDVTVYRNAHNYYKTTSSAASNSGGPHHTSHANFTPAGHAGHVPPRHKSRDMTEKLNRRPISCTVPHVLSPSLLENHQAMAIFIGSLSEFACGFSI